ncbi:hypothetical protein AK812_SmicGene4562 [Symbiodinium microadriaticum]|uniref:Reverse transcriptase domain-containing protein n=1 Tax=Symbiodinium microadriaticum TaxID=2951 RepID=A0A1Q9EW74_SYMMI|nr:hypothetical protein AK812_SmicGene4562 [Symbiodinium microadriaticum]
MKTAMTALTPHGCLDARDEGARESLLTDVVEWILSLKGHVLLGGDLNTELHESPALLFLVQRGYRTVNGKGAVTCLASGSSRGSVIDHLLVSPSLWPALQSSDVLSEAPWPTHKPIFAEFEGTAVVDTWHTLLLPRPFPLQGCVPTTDAHVVYQEEFRAISSLTKEGQHCVAYDAWTELAERELMRQCRRNAKDVSRTYCGRAAPPRLRQCQLKISGEDMCRDACDRRLERVRSGLAELCACWDVCVRENTQHALWANARRRILLVGAPHGECPADLPDRDTVKNWLTWVRAEIERRNKKHRYHAVHDWRERLKYSQADRFVWAKADLMSDPGNLRPISVWPMVQASQYADDILLMSHDASSLRDANGYLEGWMRKHGVQFNVGKCHYFCTDAKAACEDFCIGGKRLECANLLENLGGRFRLNPEGLPVADEQHKNRVYDRFKDVAERLGRLSVGWDVRAADVRAIMPMLTYSALAWDPAEFSDARRQRLLVNVLSGGKENTRRCVEVSLAVLSAVHRTCIPAALLHEQVLILGRLINVSADFRREVQEHFRLCRDMEVAPPGSFFATFQASLHEYGWHWLEWNTLTSHEGVEFSLDGDTLEARRVQVCADLGNATQADDLTRLVEAMAQGHRSMCDWSLLTHSLREAMRQCMCANAARRRRDMKGLVEVDRDRLRTLWQKVPEADHPTLRFLMQGAAMTADREHRGTKGLVSPICSHCDMGVVEDELHRYWQCPCWTEIRRECLGDVSDELCSSIIQLPSASSVCAIPVKQLPSKVGDPQMLVPCFLGWALMFGLCPHAFCCTTQGLLIYVWSPRFSLRSAVLQFAGKCTTMKTAMKKVMKSSAMKAKTTMKAKAMKAMKKKAVSKIATGKRAKSVVFRGSKEKTSGGLAKSQLMKNKRGKVVSKKMHAKGKTIQKFVQQWLDAVMTARKELGIKGFCAVGGKSAQGKALYAKAKALYAA